MLRRALYLRKGARAALIHRSNPPHQYQLVLAPSGVFLRSHFGGLSAQSARSLGPQNAPQVFIFEKGRARAALRT